MTTFRPIYFNGKFYGRGLNGVHRVADRLIRECDRILCGMPDAERPEAVLLAPRDSSWVPELSAIRVERVRSAGLLWEQVALPARSAGGVLVNLANIAPVAHRRKITMIHDAQFLFTDCGYPLRQRIAYRLLSRPMARTSARVLTVSNYSRRVLDACGVSRDEKMQVIHNGAEHILEVHADVDFRRSVGLERHGYVVMFGSPKPYKNNKVVFDAFASGRLSKLRLVVVGPNATELADSGLAVPADALLVGRIGDDQLRALLSDALLMAFPSKTEGFGLPPLEAMLCHCPVVASPAGAIPEACGNAAVYADPDSADDWCDAISSLATDVERRHAQIDEGLFRASRYTWKRAGNRLFEIAKELASRESGVRSPQSDIDKSLKNNCSQERLHRAHAYRDEHPAKEVVQ